MLDDRFEPARDHALGVANALHYLVPQFNPDTTARAAQRTQIEDAAGAAYATAQMRKIEERERAVAVHLAEAEKAALALARLYRSIQQHL